MEFDRVMRVLWLVAFVASVGWLGHTATEMFRYEPVGDDLGYLWDRKEHEFCGVDGSGDGSCFGPGTEVYERAAKNSAPLETLEPLPQVP